MIGITIKILADMVTDIADSNTLAKIYQKAGVETDKVYNLNEAYADDEWQRILQATLEVMSLSKEEAYAAYSKAFLTYAETMFPTWFAMPIIHVIFYCYSPPFIIVFPLAYQAPQKNKK
jgi:hypothetical protein